MHSFLWEDFMKYLQYRHTPELIPAHKHIFEGTPIVNDEFLVHIREGRCQYVRGDTRRLTQTGVVVNVRDYDSHPGDDGQEVLYIQLGNLCLNLLIISHRNTYLQMLWC